MFNPIINILVDCIYKRLEAKQSELLKRRNSAPEPMRKEGRRDSFCRKLVPGLRRTQSDSTKHSSSASSSTRSSRSKTPKTPSPSPHAVPADAARVTRKSSVSRHNSSANRQRHRPPRRGRSRGTSEGTSREREHVLDKATVDDLALDPRRSFHDSETRRQVSLNHRRSMSQDGYYRPCACRGLSDFAYDEHLFGPVQVQVR